MLQIKLVIPGEPTVKKNTMKTMWFRETGGVKIPLKRPVRYYTTAYKKWAAKAILMMKEWKVQNSGRYQLPFEGAYIVTMYLYKYRRDTVDLSALYEGVQDLLIGHVGNFLDRTRTIGGIKTKIKFDHSIYTIMADDNCKIITNHGASKVWFVPEKSMAHSEIFITEYSAEKIEHIFNYLYPQLEPGDDQILRLKL